MRVQFTLTLSISKSTGQNADLRRVGLATNSNKGQFVCEVHQSSYLPKPFFRNSQLFATSFFLSFLRLFALRLRKFLDGFMEYSKNATFLGTTLHEYYRGKSLFSTGAKSLKKIK